MILIAELYNRKKLILTYKAEKEADQAGMSVDEFIKEILKINPQFSRGYAK